MKRLTLILVCVITTSLSVFCQEYYWYNGRKISLERGTQHYIIYQENDIVEKNALHFVERGNISSMSNTIKWGIVATNDTLLLNIPMYHVSSFLSPGSTQEMYATHRFFVKLKEQADLEFLDSLSYQYNLTIEDEEDALPLWYILDCSNQSIYNSVDLANIFYESGLFEAAEPELLNTTVMDCVNDPKFNQQWNLRNWGQNPLSNGDVDIHYCDAHSITSGDTAIIIGVFDRGIDLTHPDINLHPFSFDVDSQSSPSQVYHYHGTACAGIISAKTDNNLGVAGIAPKCPVMSISFNNTSVYNIGLGFKKAADKGCAVISNSWHLNTPSQLVDDGISYALSNGRAGKGCVIVFSAGNENRDSINYPANSNDNIIVVGAMSPCGERCNPYSCDAETWWGSNYGNKLDIMAPGVEIPTTDIVGIAGNDTSNYIMDFNGTSSACPHVAAVAGLILSVNPYLDQSEVSDIIETTAQKIGMGFGNNPNRPNGTWSSGFGYGLVDAYAAVLSAKERYPIQGPDYYCDTTCFYLNDTSSGSTYIWSVIEPLYTFGSYEIISGQGTSNVCVAHIEPNINPGVPIASINSIEEFTPPYINTYLPPSIRVTVFDGNTIQTYEKILRKPIGAKPTVNVSDNSYNWRIGNTRTFTITNCANEPDNVFLWVVKQGNIIRQTGIGKTFAYRPTLSGFYTVSVTNTEKECGNGTTTFSYYVSSLKMVLNAIEEEDFLNISIIQDIDDTNNTHAQLDTHNNTNYILELWSSIYGCMYAKPITNNNPLQISTHHFPKGVYVVLLKENDIIIAERKVLIQ